MSEKSHSQTCYGKGSVYRKVDQGKWDLGWLRTFGTKCKECDGTGVSNTNDDFGTSPCGYCHGVGYVEKPKKCKK